MNNLSGTATSASMRYLLSINLGSLVGLTNRQAIVFNALDMTISSLATFLFKKMGKNGIGQLILGRSLGFIASFAISSLAVGRLNFVVSLVVSGISQFTGWSVNEMMSDGSRRKLNII